ncbi:GAF domain-containing sensor histidine kinase [Heyndrickxia sp. NPDC080065]|uniref:GAF domain-containing sensor histidine kinase n=1 Tax=Heyndrickxia sp. NPDC080065 TaxID=3390568 RepID=UPI003D00F794
MVKRDEMIELLTGVQSSKRNYYTELKKTIAETKKKNLQLEIINDVMKSFNVNMSMDGMLKNISDKLKTIFFIDHISLSIRKNNQLMMSNLYPMEWKDSGYELIFYKEKSLFWEAIDSREMVYQKISNGSRIQQYLELDILAKMKMKCVLAIPLFSKDNIIGVLCISSKKETQYNHADLSFFQQLSDQLAVCLENVRLFNEVLNSKKEWENTFRAVKDMIIVVDINGKILRMNDAAKNDLNLKDERNLEEAFGQETDFKKLLLKCIHTREPSYEELKLFNQRICEVHSYPVFNEIDEMDGMILYLKDVSNKRIIEAQLIQSGKLAAIGEMAAGVAHELNNPLTAVLGNSQLLLRNTEKNDLSYKLLTDIYHCGKRCKHIIQNLLTFSRQDEYLFEEFSVNEAIDQVLSIIGYQIEKQNIHIEVKKEEPMLPINGSIQQIGQIIINLLLNAKDALENCHSKQKKITIASNIHMEGEKKWVTLSVTDNGAGIQADRIQEIFNPFYTTKKAVKGTGLGLSVSLGIAEAHGGTIKVNSMYENGSTFTLILPTHIEGGLEYGEHFNYR